MTADALTARLPGVLGSALGLDPAAITVEGLHRLTGGASRNTWAFDAVFPAGRRALILRTGPPDEIHASMELEARAQAAAGSAGAPVPHILVADNSEGALGNPFLICDEVKGETVVRRIDRRLDETGRARLLNQCAEALAAIHRTDPGDIGLTAEDPLTQCRAQLDAMGDTTATFEWAFRWLSARRPAPVPPRLVHGDFRMGNLMVDESGLAAVLDWELVHLGDACEDLAWFCIRAWRFGASAERSAGGLGDIDSFLSAYEQASATTVDRTRFTWWQVLSTLRWGVICRYQAHRHLTGQTRSVELAAIGRRVCETEWDLLELLAPPGDAAGRQTAAREEAGQSAPRGNDAAAPEPAASADTVTGAYGRPTAAELVAAVAEFLDDDVRTAVSERVNFHARVAANALRIVERELLDDSQHQFRAALSALGFDNEATLAAAVRAGELDQRADDVIGCLRTLVRHRLAVAHPGYHRD